MNTPSRGCRGIVLAFRCVVVLAMFGGLVSARGQNPVPADPPDDYQIPPPPPPAAPVAPPLEFNPAPPPSLDKINDFLSKSQPASTTTKADESKKTDASKKTGSESKSATSALSEFAEFEKAFAGGDPRIAPGQTLLNQGWTRLAIESFRRLLRDDPDHFEGRIWLAIAYSRIGLDDLAASEIEDALKRGHDVPSGQLNWAYDWLAFCYHHKKDCARALAACQKAIQYSPDDAESYYCRASVHAEMGEHAKAVEDLTRVVEARPTMVGAWQSRARSFAELGMLDRALSDAEMAIRVHEWGGLSRRVRGEIRLRMGQFDRAIEDFDQALVLGDRSIEVYRLRARAHQAKGNHEQALDDIEAAISKQTGGKLILMASGSWDLLAEVPAIKLLLAVPALRKPIVATFSGWPQFCEGRFLADRAICDYRRALADCPNLPRRVIFFHSDDDAVLQGVGCAPSGLSIVWAPPGKDRSKAGHDEFAHVLIGAFHNVPSPELSSDYLLEGDLHLLMKDTENALVSYREALEEAINDKQRQAAQARIKMARERKSTGGLSLLGSR